MLTQHEAVSYLLDQKLIRPSDIVSGGLTVTDISRRHHNYRISSGHGAKYVLKQGVGQERAVAIEHEAAMYQFLHSEFKDLSPYLPRFHTYDAENDVLVLELIGDAPNLREYHLQQDDFSISLARELGTALGMLHSIRWKNYTQEIDQHVTDQPAWILSVHRPTIKFFQECSAANVQLIHTVQQFPEFCGLLDELRENWQTEALIHRDIRWDNCVVFGKSPSHPNSQLKLIDWETASFGDPCWDVGSVFNEYLNFWLLSIPVTGEMPPAQFLELASYPLEDMQPAIRTFWETYMTQMNLHVVTADKWLIRSVRFSAGRLLQTAFEQMQTSVQLTGNILCFLQLSLNILQRPQEAAAQLLGIPLRQMRFHD